MSVAQTRAAARKIKLRYRGGRSGLSTSQLVERERAKAARQAAASRKSK